MTEFEFYTEHQAQFFYGPVAKKLMDELFSRFGVLDGRVFLKQRNDNDLWLGRVICIWPTGAVLASTGDWALTERRAAMLALRVMIKQLSDWHDSGVFSEFLKGVQK